MYNEYLYTIKFVFVDNIDLFSDNHYSYKCYHYNSLDQLFFDLKYDLKNDFINCIEMLVSKND